MTMFFMTKSVFEGLLKNGNICSLCLIKTEENGMNINDEVYLENEHDNSVLLFDIITTVLGEDVNSTFLTDKICNVCVSSSIQSYTFIEACKRSKKAIDELVDNFNQCIDYTIVETEKTKTIYLCSDTENKVKSYCDRNISKNSNTKALKRLKVLERKKSMHKIKTENVAENNFSDIEEPSVSNSDFNDKEHKIICEYCSRKFPDSKGLRAHYVRVHAPKVFKCNKCPKKFGAAYLLKLHKSESHISVMCAQCGKTYNNIHSLKMHSFSHAKLTCPICGRQYKTRTSYRKHVQYKSCTKEHKIKRLNVEKNYTCNVCNKSFAHKGTLQVHINFEHENGKSFTCSWCNKKFPAQSRLKSHIVKHTRERNFTCEVCGGKFVTKEALLYHTRIHTGETPYDCPHCDLKFLSASRRMDHVRRKHMGPTLECDICNSKFRTPCSLRKHKKRHFNPNSRLFALSQPETLEV